MEGVIWSQVLNLLSGKPYRTVLTLQQPTPYYMVYSPCMSST